MATFSSVHGWDFQKLNVFTIEEAIYIRTDIQFNYK